MALVVGTNSYVTDAEAVAFAAEVFDRGDFATVSASAREDALIAATFDIQREPWAGRQTDTDTTAQPLAFPRHPETTITNPVKRAQVTQAIWLYTGRHSRGDLARQGVRSYSLPGGTSEQIAGARRLCDAARAYLSDWLVLGARVA